MASSMLSAKVRVSSVAKASPSRRTVVVQASSRTLWLPNSTAPAHLTGKLAGDNGFDPLVE